MDGLQETVIGDGYSKEFGIGTKNHVENPVWSQKS